MASRGQEVADLLTAVLENVSKNGSSFTIECIADIQTRSLVASGLAPTKDYNSLLKDLNEINRLLRAKTASKKCENAYEICRSLITIDFEQSSEVLFEHLSLLDSKQTADFLSLLIQLKQNDLPEIKLVAVLTSALKNFESLQFSSDNKSINATFASAIISNKQMQAAFAIISAVFSAAITKSALIKELRRSPIQEMQRLLEVLLVIIRNVPITASLSVETQFLPSFEQLGQWTEVLLDAYYLNFCLKEDWKDLLEKIDDEIRQKLSLYEISKSFSESSRTYQKCAQTIKAAVEKTDSQFYVQSIYL